MEGLRGLAAFLVFLVHYCSAAEPWTAPQLRGFADAVHSIGSVGVDLFFCLSGYLIYGSLIARPVRWLPYLRRRIERIYPAFLVVLTVYVVLSLVAPNESKLPRHGAWLYLLQNALLLPGIFPIEPMITVAWSLSYEMFFYLTVPLLVGALSLRERSPAERVLYLLPLAAACVLTETHPRIALFVAGMVLVELTRSQPHKPPSLIAAVLAVIAWLTSPILPIVSLLKYSALFFGVLLFTWHALSGSSVLTRWLTWAPLRWLGNMSYSYYLLHGLTLKISFAALAAVAPVGTHLAVVLLIPAFGVTLVPCAMLFVFVERPFSIAPRELLVWVPCGSLRCEAFREWQK